MGVVWKHVTDCLRSWHGCITWSPTRMAKQHQLSDDENIMSQDGSQNTQVVFWEGKIGEVLPSYVESCSE